MKEKNEQSCEKVNALNQRITALDNQPYFGNDIGAIYTKEKTSFKVWAPDADSVYVNLYKTGSKEDDSFIYKVSMTQEENIWSVEINEDLEGLFYTYVFVRGDLTFEAVDIYAKAVGINGDRGAIIDFSKTNPKGWEETEHVFVEKLTDSLIWEVHVEDFSSCENSGISQENRGKYLAFTEKNTTLNDAGKVATCLNYLKELKVNYVHLLPVFDFANDEESDDYNWGYDPKNYNVPEGRYATDPVNPYKRILEFKKMVQSLHEENIGVILDVVFNHTYLTEKSWFNLSVPDYYYRQTASGDFADGSCCGNEVASERKMVRKFIVDSIMHWATEYKIDGFRFDLMGLIDVETMNAVRTALDNAGLEKIVVYGEPWDAGTNEIKAPNRPANKREICYLKDRIAVFNDDLRDAVKGDVFEATDGGFVQGVDGEKQIKGIRYTSGLAAAILGNNCQRNDLENEDLWAKEPAQVIAYLSAHDNLTLWDKLVATTFDATKPDSYQRNELLVEMNKLAAVLLFTSQGGIFLQAGEEFARSKLGDENSYISPITVNQIDWSLRETFSDLNDFYQGLFSLREAYPPLRDATEQTALAIRFIPNLGENLIAYTIPNNQLGGMWKQLMVVVNSQNKVCQVKLAEVPSKPWQILANNHRAGTMSLGEINGQVLEMAPTSLLILAEPY